MFWAYRLNSFFSVEDMSFSDNSQLKGASRGSVMARGRFTFRDHLTYFRDHLIFLFIRLYRNINENINEI